MPSDTITRLRSFSREHAIGSKMLANGHFYIALLAHSFKQFIRAGIGLVDDCYVLHTSFLGIQFVPSGFEFHF